MKRTTTVFGLVLALAAGVLIAHAATGCYDAHSPNLPECDPRHPDPSAGCWDKKPGDAGADG